MNEYLLKSGALPILARGDAEHAAAATFQWLQQEAPRYSGNSAGTTLYDILSYLMDRGNELGFSYETSLEGETTVFTVISPVRTTEIDIPAFVARLVEQICKALGNCEPAIEYSGRNTVVKVNLLNGR